MKPRCLCIVLAAGEGTRMRSALPKILHKIANLPMICHVVDTLAQLDIDKVLVVLGNQAELVQKTVTEFVESSHKDLTPASLDYPAQPDYIVQSERRGTAHAVLACEKELAKDYDHILIVFGDTPLVQKESLVKAIDLLTLGADIGVLGFMSDSPSGYGRLVEIDGELTEIVEEKDASAQQRRISFCNAGLMAVRAEQALALLRAIGNDNANGEFYLTDMVKIAKQRGLTVKAIEIPFDDVIGVNSLAQLAAADAIWQQRKKTQLMAKGVALQMPETIYLSYNTQLAPGVTVEPHVYFGANVLVESGAHIHAFSYIEGANIKAGAKIGPFARLRAGSNIGKDAKIGNFCEVKNAHIDKGAKVNHLSYIGDATIGEGSNIGAGVITCNYDGLHKWKTTIKPGAFVGSNTALVAPVTVESGAYVASGSVITENVPKDALAIARARQLNKADYARLIRERG